MLQCLLICVLVIVPTEYLNKSYDTIGFLTAGESALVVMPRWWILYGRHKRIEQLRLSRPVTLRVHADSLLEMSVSFLYHKHINETINSQGPFATHIRIFSEFFLTLLRCLSDDLFLGSTRRFPTACGVG
jgi:hypothetical protein